MNSNDNLKQQKKKMKNIEGLKKIYYIIFVLYIALFFIWHFVKTDPMFNTTIVDKIAPNSNGVSLSIKDSLIIRELVVMRYKDYLINSNYEKAYGMLSKEYKQYASYDDYVDSLSGIDFNSIDMKDAKSRSSSTYELTIVYKKDNKDMETEYLVYADEVIESKYTISPDKFLYSYKNQEFKKNGFTFNIDQCVVYTDRIELNGSISYSSFFKPKATIEGISVTQGSFSKYEPLYRVVSKGEKFSFNLVYNDSKYFIPTGVALNVENGKKIKEYPFIFEENDKNT